MTFQDKSIFVTGGGTGIGAAIARRFTALGGKVAIIGRRMDPLQEVAEEIGCLAIAADAAHAPSVDAAMARAAEAHGGIDVVVANAGTAQIGSIIDTTDAIWDEALRSNLTTAFVTTRSAMPWLVRRGGAIVIISSLGSVEVVPEMCGYVTAKHALIGLTKSIAHDFGKFGVRANAISPGFVRTPMADQTMSAIMQRDGISLNEAYEIVTAHQPVARPAEPDDVAAAATFLASEDASLITGSNMILDGGNSIVCGQMLRANFDADPRR